jgi:DNA-binding LytR/AlgR family response regulator
MPYSIVICDDNTADSGRIAEYVSNWCAASGQIAAVRMFPSAEAFLFAYEEDRSFEILLLDVEMAGMSGLELAKRLRAEDNRAEIIFITSHVEFTGEGYEVDALHYLVKPVTPQKLCAVLDKAAAKLRVQPHSVVVSSESGMLRLSEPDILYAEAFLHYIDIHTKDAVHKVKESISAFEKLLSGDFFRIHRSYLVSLKAVVRFTRTEVELYTGEKLPLSRAKYDELSRAFIAHH